MAKRHEYLQDQEGVFFNGVRNRLARCTSITRHVSKMQQIATIEIAAVPGGDSAIEGRFFNTSLQKEITNAKCEVRLAFGGAQWKYHVGAVAAGSIRFGDGEDSLILESRLDGHMFGDSLDKPRFVAKEFGSKRFSRVFIDFPLVFNPYVDGRVFGNLYIDTENPVLACVLADQVPKYPEDDSPISEKFSIRTAARYLCGLLNSAETHVSNPSAAEYERLPDNRDTLRNVKIAKGTFLPEALDKVMADYGYYARVEMPNTLNAAVKPFIRFAKRGVSTDKIRLKGQAYKAQLDLAKNQVESTNISVDMVRNGANRLTLYGALPTFESTFELMPGWPQAYDEETDYQKLAIDSEWARSTPGGERVWRYWVLNENGDYDDQRTMPAEFNPKDHFEQFFRFSVKRRRRFLPTLSQFEDESLTGIHNGVYAEFSIDGGENWHSINGSDPLARTEGSELRRGLAMPSMRVLKKECGIQFTGTYPPRELMAVGLDESTHRPKARIRVTATMESDLPIDGFEVLPSPLTDDRSMVLDVSGKYRMDLVDRKSIFYDFVTKDTSYRSREVDDLVAIQDAAEILGSSWGSPTVSGTITLLNSANQSLPVLPSGVIEASEALGFSVVDITGRNFSFGVATDRYPTIESITHDFERGQIRLDLKTYRGVLT